MTRRNGPPNQVPAEAFTHETNANVSMNGFGLDASDTASERNNTVDSHRQKASDGALADQHDNLKEWAHDTGVLSQGKDSIKYRLMYPKGNKACDGIC